MHSLFVVVVVLNSSKQLFSVTDETVFADCFMRGSRGPAAAVEHLSVIYSDILCCQEKKKVIGVFLSTPVTLVTVMTMFYL